jgi:two-component system, LytTR family, response regulator LytT
LQLAPVFPQPIATIRSFMPFAMPTPAGRRIFGILTEVDHMKVLVVDDEKYSSRKLERMLKKFDRTIDIVATVPSIISSVDWLDKNGSPDLILVSKPILREKTNNLISLFGLEATVIFSLQDDQYSFSAFRKNNFGLLLKDGIAASAGTAPKKDLLPSEIEALLKSQLAEKTNQYRQRFLVKHGQRYVSIETTDIAYFFSFERFVYFKNHAAQKFLVEYSLEELELMLDPAQYFRVNRSLLIAFKAVKQISPYSGNRLKLQLNPPFEKEVIVSRDKMHDFKAWLGE